MSFVYFQIFIAFQTQLYVNNADNVFSNKLSYVTINVKWFWSVGEGCWKYVDSLYFCFYGALDVTRLSYKTRN